MRLLTGVLLSQSAITLYNVDLEPGQTLIYDKYDFGELSCPIKMKK